MDCRLRTFSPDRRAVGALLSLMGFVAACLCTYSPSGFAQKTRSYSVHAELPPLVRSTLMLPNTLAVELIIDASGSMAGKLQGVSKIEIARNALEQIFPKLENDLIKVGLRAYGFDNTVEKTPKTSCSNSTLLQAIESGNTHQLQTVTRTLEPYGYTPIAASLSLAGTDLAATDSSRKAIVLITDGEETCGGNPVDTATRLSALYPELKIHVVGFDLDKKTRIQMQDIAAAGNGNYYHAQDASNLAKSLSDAVDVVRTSAAQDNKKPIKWTDGGGAAETATAVTPGVYAISTVIEKGHASWFTVAAESGQQVVFRGLNESRNGKTSSFTMALHSEDGERLSGRMTDVSASLGSTGQLSLMSTASRNILLSVGNDQEAVTSLPVFAFDVREAGDIHENYDAPPHLNAETRTVTTHHQHRAHLGDGDRADVYEIEIPGTATRLIVTTRFLVARFKHTVEIFDGSGTRIYSKYAQGQANVSIQIPPRTTSLRLRIVDRNTIAEGSVSPYSFVVTH